MNEQAIRVSLPGTTLGFLRRVRRALESILPKILIIKEVLSLGISCPGIEFSSIPIYCCSQEQVES
jgi:hypothetical protein